MSHVCQVVVASIKPLVSAVHNCNAQATAKPVTSSTVNVNQSLDTLLIVVVFVPSVIVSPFLKNQATSSSTTIKLLVISTIAPELVVSLGV
jgi:hypothetical protein